MSYCKSVSEFSYEMTKDFETHTCKEKRSRNETCKNNSDGGYLDKKQKS